MGHPEYHVNVNLSVVQLLQNDMKEKVREVLEETKMDPANLTLEVTESLAINDISASAPLHGSPGLEISTIG